MVNNRKKKVEFIQQILEKYPEFKVVEFSKMSSPMILESPEGIFYKKKCAYRFLSHPIGIESILNKEQYIQRKLNILEIPLKLLHYNGMKEKVIVEDKNGFTYSPTCYDLLKGHPVSIVSCNEKEELFKFKANVKHNYKYSYGEFKYTTGRQYIPIICPIHGEFKCRAESHLFGQGCPGCKKDSSSFSKSLWIEKFKSKLCTFYILEFHNNCEHFIKVGVTSRNTRTRYYGESNYNYSVILELTDNSKTISNLEKEFLSKYKDNKYYPLLPFQGKTECFSINIKNQIYEQFNI